MKEDFPLLVLPPISHRQLYSKYFFYLSTDDPQLNDGDHIWYNIQCATITNEEVKTTIKFTHDVFNLAHLNEPSSHYIFNQN